MQRFVFVAVVFVLFASSAQAGRMLTQQPTVSANILMTCIGGKHSACSATVTLKNADGAAVPDATVMYKWNTATVGRTAVSNTSGRISTMERMEAEAKSCSLQIISVSVAGVPQRISSLRRPSVPSAGCERVLNQAYQVKTVSLYSSPK